VIAVNCQLGLIVLDGLARGFDQKEMEQKLGGAIWEIYENIDEIGKSVDASASRVAAEWAAPAEKENISLTYLKTVQSWEPPKEGFESRVTNMAIEKLAKDSGWFSLAHEETLHRLVESGVIAKDSFEYIVYSHYVSALIDRLQVKREADEAFDKFWKAF